MKRNLTIILVVVALVAIAVVLYLVFRPDGREPGVVSVAANLPLTGNLAIYGTAIRDGGLLAEKDLETANPNGPMMDIDWQDNASGTTEAVSILQQQLANNPDVYTSGLKPQFMSVGDQVSDAGIPNFAWVFDVRINPAGGTGNNLRSFVSYKGEADVYLEYADRVNPQRVAIVYANLPHAEEEFSQLVIPALEADGIEVTTEVYDLDLEDYSSIALRVRAFGPDLIILNGFPFTLVSIVRAFQPLGLIADGNTIGTFDMLDVGGFLGADELEGIRVIAPEFVMDINDDRVSEWRDRFEDEFGSAPWYTTAFGYDMVQIIYDAASRLNLPASHEQWLSALRATDIQGITGRLRFDEDGDLMTSLEILVYRNGVLVED